MKRFNIGNVIATTLLVLVIAGLIVLNSYVLDLTHGYYNMVEILF